MLLIQSSSSFRTWTSRALMVYFRRALLFLVISPRQNRNNNHCILQQKSVYFSDAEDDEEISMMDEKIIFKGLTFDQNQNNSNQISQSKRDLVKEYVVKKLSQELNNSIRKETINESSLKFISTSLTSTIFPLKQTPWKEKFEPSTFNSNQGSNSFLIKTMNNININENKGPDDSVYQTNCSCSSWQKPPINYHSPIYTLPPCNPYFNFTSRTPTYLSCAPSVSVCNSIDDDISSSESNQSSLPKSPDHYSSTSIRENSSQSSDTKDDIYEKYQTSFSHILHRTKSLHTLRQEDKLESMLVLETNTSIITVCQLSYPFSHSMITSHICVRLIANQRDLSIQCDTKPIGCKKPLLNNTIKSTSIDNEQPSSKSFTKKFEGSSILIDIPYKMFYIDS